MIDLTFRATDRAAFIEFVTSVNVESFLGPVLIPDGAGDYDADAEIRWDEIGPRVISPGVYDGDGNEITPPVIDSRYHATLRLLGQKYTDILEETWNWPVDGNGDPKPLSDWTLDEYLDRTKVGFVFKQNGTEQTDEGTWQQLQLGPKVVQLLFPASIQPFRVWAGGMRY